MSPLYEAFQQEFKVIEADTPELIGIAQELRYQVYCVENPFEDPNEHPSGREQDCYDERSVHALVAHRGSGAFAGAVRLVLPQPGDSGTPFPIEEHCLNSLSSSVPVPGVLRQSLAEISRFAISKEIKRCIAQADGGASNSGEYNGRGLPQDNSHFLPHTILGLFAGIVRLSAAYGVTQWYAAMEPTLLRLLSRFGIYFEKIGPVVEYHGRRVPTLGGVDKVLAGIYRERPDVWEVITDRGRVWPMVPAAANP